MGMRKPYKSKWPPFRGYAATTNELRKELVQCAHRIEQFGADVASGKLTPVRAEFQTNLQRSKVDKLRAELLRRGVVEAVPVGVRGQDVAHYG